MWTKEEITLLKEHYPRVGASGCTTYISRTRQAIASKACSMGLKLISGPGTKHDHSWYESELFRKEIDHYPVEKYKGYDTPILHECLNGHRYLRSPNNVLRGSDCLECAGMSKSDDESYEAKLVKLGIQYRPLEKYINTDTPILHECKDCGGNWKSRPSHILSGHGCPKCRRPGGYSFSFFANKPEVANSPGICYLVVLIDKDTKQKVCYKIGITKGSSNKDILKRMSGIKEYEARVLKFHKGNLLEVFTLEQRLHSKWKTYKYVPDKKFGGAQECFELNDLIVKTFPFVD